MTTEPKPIAVYYEHPDWFRLLFAELDRREIPYLPINADRHQYDPAETEIPFALLFNRMGLWHTCAATGTPSSTL